MEKQIVSFETIVEGTLDRMLCVSAKYRTSEQYNPNHSFIVDEKSTNYKFILKELKRLHKINRIDFSVYYVYGESYRTGETVISYRATDQYDYDINDLKSVLDRVLRVSRLHVDKYNFDLQVDNCNTEIGYELMTVRQLFKKIPVECNNKAYRAYLKELKKDQ